MGQYEANHWIFQQDSAPAHAARITQEWLRNNVPEFISSTEWPPYSPDLNPMDFSVWEILESKVCSTSYKNLNAFKRALMREWAKIPQSTRRTTTMEFRKRLDLIIRAKGDHIEH